MQCKVCGGPATGACRGCGGFYCAKHGGVRLGWPTCGPCLESSRPVKVVSACMMVGLGIFVLSMAIGLSAWFLALPGMGLLGVAAWGFSEAMRPNPWVDGPRE
jgi:hypothetical protein